MGCDEGMENCGVGVGSIVDVMSGQKPPDSRLPEPPNAKHPVDTGANRISSQVGNADRKLRTLQGEEEEQEAEAAEEDKQEEDDDYDKEDEEEEAEAEEEEQEEDDDDKEEEEDEDEEEETEEERDGKVQETAQLFGGFGATISDRKTALDTGQEG